MDTIPYEILALLSSSEHYDPRIGCLSPPFSPQSMSSSSNDVFSPLKMICTCVGQGHCIYCLTNGPNKVYKYLLSVVEEFLVGKFSEGRCTKCKRYGNDQFSPYLVCFHCKCKILTDLPERVSVFDTCAKCKKPLMDLTNIDGIRFYSCSTPNCNGYMKANVENDPRTNKCVLSSGCPNSTDHVQILDWDEYTKCLVCSKLISPRSKEIIKELNVPDLRQDTLIFEENCIITRNMATLNDGEKIIKSPKTVCCSGRIIISALGSNPPKCKKCGSLARYVIFKKHMYVLVQEGHMYKFIPIPDLDMVAQYNPHINALDKNFSVDRDALGPKHWITTLNKDSSLCSFPIRFPTNKEILVWKKYVQTFKEVYHFCGSGTLYFDFQGDLKCSQCGPILATFKCKKCSCAKALFNGKVLICQDCLEPQEFFTDKQKCFLCKSLLVYNKAARVWKCTSDCKILCVIHNKALIPMSAYNGRLRCPLCVDLSHCYGCDTLKSFDPEEHSNCKKCLRCHAPLYGGICRICAKITKCSICGQSKDVNHPAECWRICPRHPDSVVRITKTKCAHYVQARDPEYACSKCFAFDSEGKKLYFCECKNQWLYLKNKCGCYRKRGESQKVEYIFCLKCPCPCGKPMQRHKNGHIKCSDGHCNQGCLIHLNEVYMTETGPKCRECERLPCSGCGAKKCTRNCGLTHCRIHNIELKNKICLLCDISCLYCGRENYHFSYKTKSGSVSFYDCPSCTSYCKVCKAMESTSHPCPHSVPMQSLLLDACYEKLSLKIKK